MEHSRQSTRSMARIFKDGRSPSTRLVRVKIAAVVAADEEDEEAGTATDIEFCSLVMSEGQLFG